jgi:hypothetical protein
LYKEGLFVNNPYSKLHKKLNGELKRLENEVGEVWNIDYVKINLLRTELQSLDAKAQGAIETLGYSQDTNYELIACFEWMRSGVAVLQKKLDEKDTLRSLVTPR